MLGTFHFFSFRVRVQTLGSSYSRAESRVLHFDPRAPAGGASVRLLRKSSVVASLPLQEIQAVAFDEAEPRSLILVARQRQLVDFEDAEDNLVFRWDGCGSQQAMTCTVHPHASTHVCAHGRMHAFLMHGHLCRSWPLHTAGRYPRCATHALPMQAGHCICRSGRV